MNARGSVSDERKAAMLRTAMGPEIAAALANPLTQEIMVNPDGVLRLDILGEGRVDTGIQLGAAQIERIIRLVASHVGGEATNERPIVSAELPGHGAGAGERFEGLLPPMSTGRRADGRGQRADLAGCGCAALQHPDRWRHQLGQDHARQRIAR